MRRPSGSISGGGSPGLLPMVYSGDDVEVVCSGAKKRQLSREQVRALERSFEMGNRLEGEQKARLAQELGLQPRRVAVWFQNRRARSKTKQLERDYAALRHSYDALRADHDALRRDKDALLHEIKKLKAKLGDEDASSSSVKEGAAMGSSDSDSSGVVNHNHNHNHAEKPPPPAAAPELELQHVGVEEDKTGSLGGDDDAACGGFYFEHLQPPSLPWWTEPAEHWA